MTERTLEKGTREYAKLEAVASLLTATSKHGRKYVVEDTYLDYGQDWMWTTITYEGEWCGVQILCPREWQEIMLADSIAELARIAEEIKNGKYHND